MSKIDVNSNANELAFILEQEKQTQSVIESSSLTNSARDDNTTVLNRAESIRVQQELQTLLSVQSDLNTFNDRRSLRSIRSTDSFESAPDVKIIYFSLLKLNYLILLGR